MENLIYSEQFKEALGFAIVCFADGLNQARKRNGNPNMIAKMERAFGMLTAFELMLTPNK